MRNLASTSLHDGGAIFTLAVSIVAIPFSLGVIFNYRGMAGRQHWRGGGPMRPLAARIFFSFVLAIGLIAVSFAIQRFAQGGY